MRKLRMIVALLCTAMTGKAQWTTTAAPVLSWRYDDVYFSDPDRGWAVQFSSGASGAIYKTVDGGSSWVSLPSAASGAKYRDVGFLDSLNGFIGTLSNGYNPEDTVIMYQTSDGGTTWSNVANLPGPRPAGICGMFVVNDSTLCAAGRYYGPACFYKTTDKGVTWSYKDLNALAGGIVDLHFFNKDTGIAVGGSSTAYASGSGRILRTVDGGVTWSIVHTSTHTQEICWKISFPSPTVGYVSLQSFRAGGAQYFMKTTDGGLTWTDIPFMTSGSFNAQGIGFINDTIGWIGGDPFNKFTTNGGLTWTTDNFGNRVNRFRFFSDTTAYAGGAGIYKFTPGTAGIGSQEKKPVFYLRCHPNPFISQTDIRFSLNKASKINLLIVDINGQLVKQMTRQCISGEQSISWDGTALSGYQVEPGLYLIHIETEEGLFFGRIVKAE